MAKKKPLLSCPSCGHPLTRTNGLRIDSEPDHPTEKLARSYLFCEGCGSHGCAHIHIIMKVLPPDQSINTPTHQPTAPQHF